MSVNNPRQESKRLPQPTRAKETLSWQVGASGRRTSNRDKGILFVLVKKKRYKVIPSKRSDQRLPHVRAAVLQSFCVMLLNYNVHSSPPCLRTATPPPPLQLISSASFCSTLAVQHNLFTHLTHVHHLTRALANLLHDAYTASHTISRMSAMLHRLSRVQTIA